MRVLELFSGTHSVGCVCKKKGYEVISLDRDLGAKSKFSDYISNNHIKEDIMTWDYKVFPKKHFDLITASPVCLYWSNLRSCWIGRRSKKIKEDGSIITSEDIESDINKYGKPMVDKIIEIIEYFKPEHWWIENPKTGKMRHYIAEKYPDYNTYYDFDYCKYCDWGYKKSTRFWTNIKDIIPKKCKNDCENMIDNQHKTVLGNGYEMVDGKKVLCNTKQLRAKHKKSVDGGKAKLNTKKMRITVGSNKLERYRIPEKLIEELLNKL